MITRPLGALFADWFAKPQSIGKGLNLGDGPVTVVASVTILLAVTYLAVTRSDIQRSLNDELSNRPFSPLPEA